MFARTPRLLLRPGWIEDAAALAQAIGDDAVLRNLARTPAPYGLDDARAFLSLPHRPLAPRLLAFTRTRGAPRLVGGCGIQHDDIGKPELRFWIARPYWGLGFATEAARAVMNMARAYGLPPVQAAPFIDNPASGHVLRKIGFCSTGRIEKRFSAARGGEADCLLFEEGESPDMSQDWSMEPYDAAVPAMAA
ncbi:MAG: GNAT family N-acetyltransferase [Sphingobium sp.]